MKILVVAKSTKIECDSLGMFKSESEVVEGYKRDGANWEAIVESHQHQLEIRKKFDEIIKPAYMTVGWDFFVRHHLKLLSQNYDLIISLGGDNSFTRISHFLEETPLLGVTIDPVRSHGALNSERAGSTEDIQEIARLLNGGFSVEHWTRMEWELNGEKQRPLATSEIFLGERLRKNMSRHVLVDQKGNSKEQKCSGLLVCSGAGSTGWFKSCSEFLPYSPISKEIRYVATELFRKQKNELPDDSFEEGEEIRVTSLNDDGIISIDSWEEKPFNRGAVATIRAGKPLKVAKLR